MQSRINSNWGSVMFPSTLIIRFSSISLIQLHLATLGLYRPVCRCVGHA